MESVKHCLKLRRDIYGAFIIKESTEGGETVLFVGILQMCHNLKACIGSWSVSDARREGIWYEFCIHCDFIMSIGSAKSTILAKIL